MRRTHVSSAREHEGGMHLHHRENRASWGSFSNSGTTALLLAACFLLHLAWSVQPADAVLGLDFASAVSVSSLTCMKNAGYSFVVVRIGQSTGSVDANGAQTILNARAAGFADVDAYIFPCFKCGNPVAQIQNVAKRLNDTGAVANTLWLDIEDISYWSSTNTSANIDFINQMVGELLRQNLKFATYTSYSQWSPITGNAQLPQLYSRPLWYARYDNDPSFSDFTAFGGWAKPDIKQYAGNVVVCSIGVDKNWYPENGIIPCSTNGSCIDVNTQTCPGVIQTGLCPGAANIKCCIPLAQSSSKTPAVASTAQTYVSTTPATSVAASSATPVTCQSGSNSGVCINVTTDTCSGTVVTGLCPGPANIRCCLKPTTSAAPSTGPTVTAPSTQAPATTAAGTTSTTQTPISTTQRYSSSQAASNTATGSASAGSAGGAPPNSDSSQTATIIAAALGAAAVLVIVAIVIIIRKRRVPAYDPNSFKLTPNPYHVTINRHTTDA